MRRRTFLLGGLASAGFVATGSVAYSNLYERHAVDVRRLSIHLGLTTPLRIAVLGDFHFDPLYEVDYLKRVFRLVASEQPDIVCLTGDFISKSVVRFTEFAAIFPLLRSRFGTYAVFGNYDHWSRSIRALKGHLAGSGVRLLSNKSIPLPENPGWNLGGLDSYWAGLPDPGFIERAPTTEQFILLVHEPDSFDLLTDPRVRLQLSGHTHGGQIRLPFFGALRLPTWGRNYDAGLFRRGDQQLYVNRGIGTVGPPARFDCPPEITLLSLT